MPMLKTVYYPNNIPAHRRVSVCMCVCVFYENRRRAGTGIIHFIFLYRAPQN